MYTFTYVLTFWYFVVYILYILCLFSWFQFFFIPFKTYIYVYLYLYTLYLFTDVRWIAPKGSWTMDPEDEQVVVWSFFCLGCVSHKNVKLLANNLFHLFYLFYPFYLFYSFYLCIYLSTYQPIYLSIYPSIHPSIHLSLYLSISRFQIPCKQIRVHSSCKDSHQNNLTRRAWPRC